LLAAKRELTVAAAASIGTTTAVDVFVGRHIPQKRLEDLPLPFAPVAVEADTARERAFWHGPLAPAVRASCSFPGIFGRPLFGGERYLDACVRHNVPVRYCTEADADFVIACDVVPPPDAIRHRRGGRKQVLLDVLQLSRVTDTVRSLYWLASTSGELQAGLADALFAPNLAQFSPWDFHRADEIVVAGDAQLDDWLDATRSRYEAFAHADG
jgi:NTE family protein